MYGTSVRLLVVPSNNWEETRGRCGTARGNQALFMRRDEVFAAWDIIDPILDQLAGRKPELYRTGSMGPADNLLEVDGRHWIDPYDD